MVEGKQSPKVKLQKRTIVELTNNKSWWKKLLRVLNTKSSNI